LRHLVLEPAVVFAIGLDGEGEGVDACGVFAGRRQARVGGQRDLHSHRRAFRDHAASTVLPLALLLLGRAEDADRLLHPGLVEEVARRRELGQPDATDLVAEVAGAMLAAALVVAVENWGRGGCTADLGRLVAESLDLVRSGLAPLS
jgi:hypothetical protein